MGRWDTVGLTDEERFWFYVNKKGPKRKRMRSRCWVWTGNTVKGYGRFWISGKSIQAHRYSYELLVGPITKETLDHLCRRRTCVRPSHLEPCARGENVLRGNTITRANKMKKSCVNGHRFTKSNTHLRKNGKRECRACMNERMRRRRSGDKNKV